MANLEEEQRNPSKFEGGLNRGSSWGSSSADFYIYRAQRRREAERLAKIEEEDKQIELIETHKQFDERNKVYKAKTDKNKQKRLMKKLRKELKCVESKDSQSENLDGTPDPDISEKLNDFLNEYS